MILKPETRSRQSIRSFVVRAGRLTAGQQRAIEESWPTWGAQVSGGAYQASNPGAPLILDIGFGMGQALVDCAEQHPERQYLGVEVYPPGVGSLLADVNARGITNIQVYCADVMLVLNQCLAEQSLAGVQIFFPDPWHKKRHHKRRLIQADFLTGLASRIQAGGFLHIATDWQPYAVHCKDILQAHSDFVLQATLPCTRPGTKFERRGIRLGHVVEDIYALRV